MAKVIPKRTNRSIPNSRAEPQNKSNPSTTTWFLSEEGYNTLCTTGHRRLSDNPEVTMAVHRIAELISSMTIYVMENTKLGDTRVKGELARKIDVNPYGLTTRKNWMYNIVKNLFLDGDGNMVLFPRTNKGLIEDIIPFKMNEVSFYDTAQAYQVKYQNKLYNHDEVVHFAINPKPTRPWVGESFRIQLKDVTNNLKQAAKTRNAFMSSKWRPSLIVSVDSTAGELSDMAGREKIQNQYLKTSEIGEPWIIPSELIKIDQVKPLSLKDLAINENVIIDKATVAGLLGIPKYFLGVGAFDKNEYNAWIRFTIRPIIAGIEQEMTRKLIYSPKRYIKFNPRSLMAYSIEDIEKLGASMVDRMAMDRNEWRDMAGMSPDERMVELLALENYIPANKLKDQKKLN